MQTFRWATILRHEGHTVHAVICRETRPDGDEGLWAWLTDHRPCRSNVIKLANKVGRLREQIEEEFNDQKNGELELKHDYGSSVNAWYNYYILAQISHLLLQLMRNGDLVRKLSKGMCDTLPDAFRTLRNFAIRMRECIQRDQPDPSLRGDYHSRMQIRFVAPT